MAITHVVLFQFKASATKEEIEEACKNMLALSQRCIHPTTNKPYLLSGTGGANNSTEGLTGGITHAFVSHFANLEDRDYYVKTDPVHLDFIKSVVGIMEKAQVIDYEDGKL